MDTSGTVTAWKNSIKSYPDSSLKAYEDALKLVNGPVQAAGQVWNSIQAQRVSIEEVPASARAALGDEVALNVAKNLVRNGKDPDDIAKLEPKDVIAIQYFADLFTTFAKQQESCGATGDCASGDEGQKDPVHYVDADGNSMIVNFKPLVPSTSGGNVLVQADALQTYLDKLNPAQAQLVRLGIQAVMGPVKAAVSLAGNVVVDKLFGDKIADAKDALSKSLASELSGKSKDDLEHSDDRFKELSKLGATTQKGDVYVRGATTLLDIALGIATNAAGSVAGKAIGIVGKGSSDGVTKGRDELGGGPKDPDWDKKFAENPPKGWVETGGAKGPDQALPNNQRLLSGTPGQVTGGSSTKLGQNLNQAMGRNRTDSWAGYQAQHLIPSELKNHPILKKVGIDLDDSSNGIFLPASKAKPEGAISGMPRHTGSHPNYTEAVRKSLNELDRNLPVEQLQKQVFDLQGRLRNVTGSGMPVRNVDGAKTEVWLKWLGK
ncbi:hypothetical protein PFLU4_56410 [Pseudomonas fluorescens]|nr:hypothetical protein PFLU4_56410 [Pseudomonas fluorescens]